MPKAYKILIFIVILLILAGIFLYFSPSSSKEMKVEKEVISELDENTIAVSEGNPASADNEGKSAEKTKENIVQPKTEPKETAEITINKKSDPSIKIIQNLVNWGYLAKSARTIDTIIIHSSYNALGGDEYDTGKLIKEYKDYGVSPHYLIDRKGNIYELVKDLNIAYHAGESKMPDGRTNVNNFSLGIEIMTTENEKPTEEQYSGLNNLISYLKGKYKITNILGHNQIAPGRKTDPWNFDWKKL